MNSRRRTALIDIDGTIIKYDNRLINYVLQAEHLAREFAFKKNHYHVFSSQQDAGFAYCDEKDFETLDDNTRNLSTFTKNLIKNGFNVIIATSRPAIAPIIKKTFDEIHARKIFYSMLIMGCNDKVEICKHSNIDLFIDDSRLICKRASDHVPIVINFANKNKIFKNSALFRSQPFDTATTWEEASDIASALSPDFEPTL